VWRVSDLAEHLYGERTHAAYWRAMRLIRRTEAEHGRSLRHVDGLLYVAELARLEPSWFAPADPRAFEERLERLEKRAAEQRLEIGALAAAVRATSRELRRLREIAAAPAPAMLRRAA
jgi:hypothetical protein